MLHALPWRPRRLGLLLALLLGCAASGPAAAVDAAAPRVPDQLLPFDQPAADDRRAAARRVVAHWFLWPISIDNRAPERDVYTRLLNTEAHRWDSSLRFRPLPRPPRPHADWQLADAKADIRLAQAMGIDAFHALYSRSVVDRRWGLPYGLLVLRAAHELDNGFKVSLIIGCNECAKTGPKHWSNVSAARKAGRVIEDLAAAGLTDSPALERHDGKLLIGAWYVQAAPPHWWGEVLDTFAAHGLDASLMCIFNRIGAGRHHDAYDDVCDVWTDWGARDPFRAERNLRAQWPDVGDEVLAAAVNQQDVRFRPRYSVGAEARASATLRASWRSAIAGDADWAHLVTWNDHGEHSSFVPNTATQFAFYDLNIYFISWFKTDQPPVIERDALYFFHRVHHGPPWIKRFGGTRGRWVNQIELVGMLTAPGTLEIVTEDGVTRDEVGPGLQTLTAPLPNAGRPHFRLWRDGEVVVEVTSPFEIGRPTGPDVDLAYRGGGSLRMAHGRENPAAACAQANDVATCLSPAQSEPLWLAAPEP